MVVHKPTGGDDNTCGQHCMLSYAKDEIVCN